MQLTLDTQKIGICDMCPLTYNCTFVVKSDECFDYLVNSLCQYGHVKEVQPSFTFLEKFKGRLRGLRFLQKK